VNDLLAAAAAAIVAVTGPMVVVAMFVNREEIPMYPCTEIL
jgi:hypothetical protein